MLKKLFSHTVIYGISPQIIMIVNFFTLPIITKDLTAIDFGISGTLTAYTSAISVLAVLGLRVVLVNSYYKSPMQYKWAWRQIYGFLTVWNIFYAIILAILIYFAVPKEANSNRISIVLLNVIPLVFFGQTANIGRTYYQLKKQPIQIAVRSLIFGLFTIALNILFISHCKMGYMGWFWSAFIVGLLNNFSYWYPLTQKLNFKPIFNFKKKFIKSSLKISLPTIPHFYGGYLLYSSDRLVMDQLGVSTSDLGKYSAANTFGNLVDGFGTAVGWAVGPLMNEKYKLKDDIGARNIVFLTQLAFFLITVNACLWLREIFHFVIRNSELNTMYPLAIVMVMSINYRPMYFGSSNKLFFYEKTKYLWRITMIAGLFNVILNIILIPFLGFKIAAFTTFIAFMYMGYAGFFYKNFRDINSVNYQPIKWLVTTILLTIMVYYCVELSWYIKFIIAIMFSIPVIYLILKINKKLHAGDQ